MTKIPPKPKNYQNNHETYKMTKIPLKPKNDQNIPETQKTTRGVLVILWTSGVFRSFFRFWGYSGNF